MRKGNRHIAAIAGVGLFWIVGCSRGRSTPAPAATASNPVPAASNVAAVPAPAVSIQEPPPTAQEIAELRTSVIDEGHQPWRLDPLEVAQSELLGVLEKNFGSQHFDDVENDALWTISGKDGARDADFRSGKFHAVVSVRNSDLKEMGIWFPAQVKVWKIDGKK